MPIVLLLLLSAAPGLALSPEADKRVLEGLDAAYSLDFASAAACFSDVDRLEPEHPAGPFFLASLKWLEFSQDADIPGTIDALEPQFNRIMNQAFARAERLRQKDPKNPEAAFYLGAAYGMKGRWLLLKRQWIHAASNGYKGYKLLKKTIELDPEYYDAYLGLGMYDYYSDRLPAVYKFAAWFVARGDKERGLRYVRLTLDKGHFSRVEARLFLASVYATYEKQYDKALEILGELRREKPDNLFFTFMELMTRLDARDWPGAVAFGEYLAPRARELAAARPQVSLFDLYLGEAYLGGKDYPKALETFDRCAAQAPEPRKATVTFCFLRRAQTLDLLGRRAQALADYRLVKSRPDYFDSQEKAKRGLKRSAAYDEVLKQFFE